MRAPKAVRYAAGVMPDTDNPSLYERLGGEAAVMAAVDDFYDRLIADEVTRPYFEGLDLDLQVRKQVSFLTRAFGGPVEYQGRDLRAAHARLVREQGLSDQHFDAVARHLRETLEALGISDDLIGEVLAIVGSARNDVLSR